MTHEEIASAVADVIQDHVALALAPVLARLAVAESQASQFAGQTHAFGELRDRVVVVETKAAAPAVVQQPVSDSPLLERLAAAEARLEVLGDLRDRVVTIETKSAQPLPDVPTVDLAPVHVAIADLTKEQSTLRERLAVAEVRQLIPGPMGASGADGTNGRDGVNGTNGVDGLGWDDLAVEQTDERTATIKATRGLQVKHLGTLTFPVEIYKGVYLEGKTYDRGDCVTFGGSEFHCNETTTTKPEQSKAWTLKVKRGRDGKDGRDAMDPVPVISVGRR